ncbi:3-hydroxyisobutyrate dehydrogenase [Legionella taurinensis]|uniref:3-hydroxyisobutyrate dehydrogenase n=1 Tax=Legionella taurinensis TaxID=70611 RepID=A0AB38N7Y0_9GAMM|nr:3-hydroxyisobutyrate dehydrogenase [Legionella taurinensis]MDX1836061.1 3-hydroxyisobutyrate dehydrogenase [Legionella taurinensis]PUT42162.1 3-hydroxyisobutyrate dehydrogenase [Legionella taurinensis]PUT44949.1 3-hydroxyisobutyrate dehydrogenase [Legionella taurinensis]PUT48271.1 3-hydroxyisobutyrate dehydrogenase [Legionella taurinensis]PUT49084.1 3-hydroxyisobutyrate dehydrogenase [Legionella taurinensis]
MARIGFVGLGHMGLPMAIRLIQAGHEVTGFDLQQEALTALVNAGGLRATSISDVAREKHCLITMLQTGDQVKRVCLGDDGLYAQANGALHIDCSSIDVHSARSLHQHASANQLPALDAPVSGGVAGAEAGALTFMVGGETAVLNQAMPILTAMGKKIIHTGEAGSGQAAKLCNNMILGISMIAVSEAFVLAEKLHLAADKLFEVVNSSSGQCWAMSKYAPVPNLLPDVPANRGYQPGFTAAMMLKDLNLSQQSAKAVGVETPLAAKATAIYQQFNQQGFGELDFSAIIKSLECVES